MFGLGEPDHKTAVAVDIGSSSVGVAVVCTHPEGPVEIIWEHREYSIIHDDATAQIQIKQIKTAIANAFLELSQMGLQALKDSGHDTQITEVQAVIAAPWSHTITKTISLKDDHPFTVSEELIGELVGAARKQAQLVFDTDKVAQALKLKLTHEDVLGVAINGYSVSEPLEQQGREVALTHVETAIAEEVSHTLVDTVNKFFPKAVITEYSFMYAFYLTMRNLKPNTDEICLIDVSGEATEVGIVRGDILQHTTFIPKGIYSIARDVAKVSGIPKQEAYGYMKDDSDTIAERLPKATYERVYDALTVYNDEVANMFLRTGDTLTIPKSVFMHSDARTQPFFIEQLEAAAYKATKKKHVVHPVTAKVLGVEVRQDVRLLLAINFLAQKKDYMQLLPQEV